MNVSEYRFGSSKNPYGLRKSDNCLVYVDDVENGLNCGCVCPTCKRDLIAKQGDIREHHFAHRYDKESCLHIQETYFLRAKEILEQSRQIFLPAYDEFAAKNVAIKKIDIDKFSDNPRVLPDIVVETEDGQVVHIRYKRVKNQEIYYLDSSFACLELDAKNVRLENLGKFLTVSESNKKWLSNPFYEKRKRESRQQIANESPRHYNISEVVDAQVVNYEWFENLPKPEPKQKIPNRYMANGTEQQKRIKKLFRENEYVCQNISKCNSCISPTNCKFSVEKFTHNGKDYIICRNPTLYFDKFFKEKYLTFKPLAEFNPIEQYECKI